MTIGKTTERHAVHEGTQTQEEDVLMDGVHGRNPAWNEPYYLVFDRESAIGNNLESVLACYNESIKNAKDMGFMPLPHEETHEFKEETDFVLKNHISSFIAYILLTDFFQTRWDAGDTFTGDKEKDMKVRDALTFAVHYFGTKDAESRSSITDAAKGLLNYVEETRKDTQGMPVNKNWLFDYDSEIGQGVLQTIGQMDDTAGKSGGLAEILEVALNMGSAAAELSYHAREGQREFLQPGKIDESPEGDVNLCMPANALYSLLIFTKDPQSLYSKAVFNAEEGTHFLEGDLDVYADGHTMADSAVRSAYANFLSPDNQRRFVTMQGCESVAELIGTCGGDVKHAHAENRMVTDGSAPYWIKPLDIASMIGRYGEMPVWFLAPKSAPTK